MLARIRELGRGIDQSLPAAGACGADFSKISVPFRAVENPAAEISFGIGNLVAELSQQTL